MKIRAALVAALFTVATLPALSAAPAHAARTLSDCPGSAATAHDTLVHLLKDIAQTCWYGKGKFEVRWADTRSDGKSAYAKIVYSPPGSSATKTWVSAYDSNGANNGWTTNTLRINRAQPLLVYACAKDLSAGTASVCEAGTPVAASNR